MPWKCRVTINTLWPTEYMTAVFRGQTEIWQMTLHLQHHGSTHNRPIRGSNLAKQLFPSFIFIYKNGERSLQWPLFCRENKRRGEANILSISERKGKDFPMANRALGVNSGIPVPHRLKYRSLTSSPQSSFLNTLFTHRFLLGRKSQIWTNF